MPYDLAILTLGHERHWRRRRRLRHRVDLDVIRAGVVLRILVRPLADRHGFRPVLAGLRVRRAETQL